MVNCLKIDPRPHHLGEQDASPLLPHTFVLGAGICNVDPNRSSLQRCIQALNGFAVGGNFWEELASGTVLWNVNRGVAFALTQETGLPASVSLAYRVCPLWRQKIAYGELSSEGDRSQNLHSKIYCEAPRFWEGTILTCHVVHATTSLLNNKKRALILNHEKAVKYDLKIMSCLALPSP